MQSTVFRKLKGRRLQHVVPPVSNLLVYRSLAFGYNVQECEIPIITPFFAETLARFGEIM